MEGDDRTTVDIVVEQEVTATRAVADLCRDYVYQPDDPHDPDSGMNMGRQCLHVEPNQDGAAGDGRVIQITKLNNDLAAPWANLNTLGDTCHHRGNACLQILYGTQQAAAQWNADEWATWINANVGQLVGDVERRAVRRLGGGLRHEPRRAGRHHHRRGFGRLRRNIRRARRQRGGGLR